MNEDLEFILAMSCLLPLVVSLIRFLELRKSFRIFPLLMLLDFAMEIAYKFDFYKDISFNIYLVLSFGCFLYFFIINGFIKRTALYLMIPIALLAVINFRYYTVICISFLSTRLPLTLLKSSYLFCATTLIILYIAIDVLTRQITAVNKKLVDNTWFWINSAYILSASYNLLIFCLIIFVLRNQSDFNSISAIQRYINALSYLLFTIGVLKMPKEDTASDLFARSKLK